MSNRKRSQWGEIEPEQADDFAVAASFAHVPEYQFKPVEEDEKPEVKPRDKEDEKPEVKPRDKEEQKPEDEDSESDSDEEEGKEPAADENFEGAEEKDDSDDESEVDLAEALARMNDEDEDEAPSKKPQAPKTEHEIDPYSTPMDELQSKFQLNLTVEEEEHLRLADGNPHSSTSLQLCPAGHVSCHMVEDRTIVVECTQKSPLDEGSLLVIRVGEDEKLRLLPLGKVFEVFGPISRPLYTIRLPPPPSRPKKKKAPPKATTEKKEANVEDENEISLNDAEGGEEESQPPAEEKEPEKEPDEAPLPPDDWSAKGQFTGILAAAPRQTVYYIEAGAKLLDTFAIMRTSGKGCDASNLYDEEVLNSNDLYFSDDEEERQFKSKKKKGGKASYREDRKGQPNIPGFHAPTPSQRPPPPPPPPQHYPQTAPHPPPQYYQYPQGHMPPQQYSSYQQAPGQPYQYQQGQHYQQPQHAYPPQAGQPYPPQVGQSYPPQAGQLYPPQAGQSYPPQAGQPYPPQAGQPYPPQAGQPYPPPAQYPYSNATEESDTVYYK